MLPAPYFINLFLCLETLARGEGLERINKKRALSGLIIAVVLPLLSLGSWLAPGDTIRALLIREAVWWCYAAIILIWLRLVERLPLESIGLHLPTGKTLLYAVLAAAALLLVFVIHSAVIVPFFHLNQDPASVERNIILSRPFWYRFLMVLRASVVEEILFRGYVIEKVRQLTGSSVLAVALSVLAFTYAHLSSWGLVHLIPVFAGGVIFALLYLWKRDLGSNMLAHFITDGVDFLPG